MKMKFFLIAFTLIITINFGCSKEVDLGGEYCDCPVLTAPSLNIAVRNTAGNDLLYTKTVGSFATSQIKLYAVEANGNVKNIEFTLRKPFTYGAVQYDYYQLSSSQIVSLVPTTTGVFYLKLGDLAPYKLTIKINGSTGRVDRLLINDFEAAIEQEADKNLSNGNIFYLTI